MKIVRVTIIIVVLFLCIHLKISSAISAQIPTAVSSQSTVKSNPLLLLFSIFNLFTQVPEMPEITIPPETTGSSATSAASLTPTGTQTQIIGPTSPLLPTVLGPIAPAALTFRYSVESCTIFNRTIYIEASKQTGVPWEILAAIHYNEGACHTDKSLVSGRIIGSNEPDVVRGGGCSSGRSGPGIPIPLATGGCGFNTLLDSAIYAGNHIKGKIGKVPSNFQELAKAFSRYSGGGNSNCGSTPYPHCPELFEGEDDAYVMNMFDEKHNKMYLVYCADLTKCNPPRYHLRPGVTTIIRLLTNKL